MNDLLEMLHQLHPLDDELRAELIQTLKVKELPKGGVLLKENELCDAICYIQKGLFGSFYTKGKNKLPAWFKWEGDVIFSVKSFLRRIPSKETIVALDDAVVLYITYDELQSLYIRYKDFNVNGRLLLEHYYIESVDHNAAIRYQSAEEKIRQMLEDNRALFFRIPDQYLAPFLGMHPVSLSRAKKKVLGYHKKGMA